MFSHFLQILRNVKLICLERCAGLPGCLLGHWQQGPHLRQSELLTVRRLRRYLQWLVELLAYPWLEAPSSQPVTAHHAFLTYLSAWGVQKASFAWYFWSYTTWFSPWLVLYLYALFSQGPRSRRHNVPRTLLSASYHVGHHPSAPGASLQLSRRAPLPWLSLVLGSRSLLLWQLVLWLGGQPPVVISWTTHMYALGTFPDFLCHQWVQLL